MFLKSSKFLIDHVNVEEFIDGEEYTYDTICVDGKMLYKNIGYYRPRPVIYPYAYSYYRPRPYYYRPYPYYAPAPFISVGFGPRYHW